MAKEKVKEEWDEAFDNLIPEGWEEEQTGFPPYWNPGEGKSFRGIVIARDVRDPDFVRYHIRSTQEDLECAIGPAVDAEPVKVTKGEIFTVSEYSSLPLSDLLGLEIMAVALKQVPTKKAGQSRWVWKLFLPKESRKALDTRRAESAKLLG
jgi:hypothetical protein